MNTFIKSYLLIVLIGFVAESFLPWWSIAVVCFFISALLPTKNAFLCGFLAVATLWGGYALLTNLQNEGLLAGRMAALFHLPNGISIVGITLLVGGLVGGLSALTGSLLRKSF